jgi:hypothetical protein
MDILKTENIGSITRQNLRLADQKITIKNVLDRLKI